MLETRKRIAKLRNGDLLTREEFERRYNKMPLVKKAELIEGVVYMGSPVSGHHAQPHTEWSGYLLVYRRATLGTMLYDNGTVRLARKSEPQPDLTLFVLPSHGGRVKLTKAKFIIGAPELVVEIAYSSVSLDAHAKMQAYLKAGVNEYILHRIEDEVIDWYELVDGDYSPILADADGLTRSRVFPGLALDLPAILCGDMDRVDTGLKTELAGPEHARFRDRLAAAAAGV